MRAFLACGVLVIAGLAPTARSTTPGAAGAPTGPGSLHKASVPRPALALPRAGKSVPAALGGPAKYDAKKGAMLGGTVMPHRP